MLANESIGVGGVSNDDSLGVASAVVIDGLADVDEDGTVIFEEVTSLHTRTTWLGSDKEVVVDIFEGGREVTGDHNIVKEGECAIMKLSLNTLENLLLERQVEKVKNDTLVLSQEFTRGNSVNNGVSDLASSTRNENALGLGITGGGRGGH